MAAKIADQSGEERFVKTDDYRLVLEGVDVPEAEIFHSQSVIFLILSPQLPAAVVLKLRTTSVETIAGEMIFRGDDGSIILSSDAVFHPEGEFEVDGEGISFAVQGARLRLRAP